MSNAAVKRSNSGEIIRGGLLSFVFATILVLVFSLIVKLTNMSATAVPIVNQVIKILSVFLGVFFSLKNKEKASVWLCQIAKNTYFAWYNEQKKKDSLDDLEVASCDVSIEDAIVQKELSQKALICLHELEDPYKEVSVFGGFSLKDISSIFGKSESWARVTFYRAKQKLSERMR